MFDVTSYRGIYSVLWFEDIPMDFGPNAIVVADRYIRDAYYADGNIDTSDWYVIDADETAKTLVGVDHLIDFLINRDYQRSARIACIGGGVCQDLVSFTSSILYRGVEWAFYPTTLLAQCDSCIGSKTSINYRGYKNLLGGFHPPSVVTICPSFLRSLPESEIRSGIGEMLHYFLLRHRLDLAEQMVEDSEFLDHVLHYIRESLAVKREVIERDEFDRDERNLFNYGHTFGHAIETLSGYKINHGQAVTLGMEIANRIALDRGLIPQKLYQRLASILDTNMPDYTILDPDTYLSCLQRDKKNIDEFLTCILLTEGGGTKVKIAYDEVRAVL